MRNKYNYGELVKVSGIGKEYGRVDNRLGFIIRKDVFFEDYYVELLFGGKDWFNEEAIERIFREKRNKIHKYRVRFCTTKEGYELIKARLKEKEPISNNKFKKIDYQRKFEKDGKSYIIIGWNSVYWPVSNVSIRIFENTIQQFKNLDLPFQYVLLNEDELADIKIMQNKEIDNNVDVLLIERKIRIKI